MKVSTDACVFGAWIAAKWKAFPGKVLDIGAGTGLLSLIMAQENPAVTITALEPDEQAASEAAYNFTESPWRNRLSVIKSDLASHTSGYNNRAYDFIISNPPFFEDHLTGATASRNLARHDALPMSELASMAMHLLKPSGKLAVLYPANLWDKWMNIAEENGFKAEHILQVRSRQSKEISRISGIFTTSNTTISPTISELTIHANNNEYSEEFKELMKGYYLFL